MFEMEVGFTVELLTAYWQQLFSFLNLRIVLNCWKVSAGRDLGPF